MKRTIISVALLVLAALFIGCEAPTQMKNDIRVRVDVPEESDPKSIPFPNFEGEAITGITVEWNGSFSYDPNGDPISYKWMDKNRNVMSTSMNFSEILSTSGNHIRFLEVKDAGGRIDLKPAQVTVRSPQDPINFPPNPVAFGIPSNSTAPTSITWYGGRSRDPEGKSLTFKWLTPGGQILSTDSTFVQQAEDGDTTYTVILEVSDPDGNTAPASAQITIKAPQSPQDLAPDAIAFGTPDDLTAPTMITWDGTLSRDPEGRTLRYQWKDAHGDVVSTQAIFRERATQGGIKTRILEVFDPADHGDVAVAQTMVMEAANDDPKSIPFADFEGEAITGITVEWNGSFSYDPNGDPITYKWMDKNRNVVSTEMNFSETLSAPGNHVRFLEVKDAGGRIDVKPAQVTVRSPQDPINFPPNAVAFGIPSNSTAPTSITWYGGRSRDPEGKPLTFKWLTPGGQILSTDSTFVQQAEDGDTTYTIILEVSDPAGNTAPASAQITIKAPQSPQDLAPDAIAFGTPDNLTAPTMITWDGTLSRDPEGRTLRYQWKDAHGDVVSTQAIFRERATQGGIKTRILEVFDPADHGDVAVAQTMVMDSVAAGQQIAYIDTSFVFNLDKNNVRKGRNFRIPEGTGYIDVRAQWLVRQDPQLGGEWQLGQTQYRPVLSDPRRSTDPQWIRFWPSALDFDGNDLYIAFLFQGNEGNATIRVSGIRVATDPNHQW